MKVDNEGFDKAMARQQERGRSAGGFEQKTSLSAEVIGELPETCFTGYDELSTTDTKVAAILIDGKPAEILDEGQSAVLVLDRTPFYAESGGQVGDTGKLVGNGTEFEVRDTQKLAGTFHGHVGKMVSGSMRVGESLTASIDGDRRKAIVLHHSATHLLHAALQKVLGPHVQQKGSLVAPDHLRFDFSHAQPVTSEEINTIEKMVNGEVRLNPSSEARVMAYDEAIRTGAQALFGEKYGDQVRVMRFGDFSTELCGGTHVERVGDIGLFKITAETAVASGTRRIEAVAGEAALSWVQNMEDVLRNAARKLNTAPAKLEGQIGALLEKTRAIQKEIDELKSRLAEASGDDLLSSAQDINGIPVLSVQIKDIDPKAMRETVDHLKDKLGSAVVVIGNTEGGKVRLAAGVSKDLTDKLQAGKLINFVAEQVGGKGGGRPDFAQAGGPDAEKLGDALESVAGWVMENT
jgi:alanyl-tRNA synthetase